MTSLNSSGRVLLVSLAWGVPCACAPPPTPALSVHDPLLVGTWRSTTRPAWVSSPQIMSFEQDITFAADGTLTGHTRFVWTTSDLTDTPGCTDDFTSTTPQTWSTAAVDGGLYLTVEGSADPIEALSDCPDPSNDRDAGATSGHLSGIPTWPPSGPYMLSADHNTLTAGTGRTTITYVRQ